jgi:hypothetical protein
MDSSAACAGAEEEPTHGAVADGRGRPAQTVRETRHVRDDRAGVTAR